MFSAVSMPTEHFVKTMPAVTLVPWLVDRPTDVDAMSSFGAIPIDVNETPIDVVISSSNKCLEGVPGLAFAVARHEILAASAGNAPSMVLDLHAQAAGFEWSELREGFYFIHDSHVRIRNANQSLQVIPGRYSKSETYSVALVLPPSTVALSF